jgi:hypothetical protein
VNWWAVVRLLEYPGGSRERIEQRRHTRLPELRRADECPIAGAEGGNDFELGYQVRMPSCQPFPAVLVIAGVLGGWGVAVDRTQVVQAMPVPGWRPGWRAAPAR